jgi:pimeloyl-ACP methyl ester carboxylesterase
MICYEELGSRENPTLVCIPGLLGGPIDFSVMTPVWKEKAHFIVLDPDRNRFQGPTAALSHEEMTEGLYNSSSEDIVEILDHLGIKSAFLVGISLGSKIVYDFAVKNKERFLGGVSIDVGPGPFEETALHRFVDEFVIKLDLNIPFEEMKVLLNERIPDRNLRSMIRTQLYYPNRKPPAIWRSGMKHFGEMLGQSLKEGDIQDQFAGLEAIDGYLASHKRYIYVLHAETISAINADTLPRLKAFKSVKFTSVPNTSHFLHVTHKEVVIEEVLKMLREGTAK